MNNNAFKQTSPLIKGLTAICNLIIVNIIFMITCIPVITIGASLCALYKICFEIIEGEDVFVFRDYFMTFASNFKKATLLWVPIMLIDAFMFFEMLIVNSGMEGTALWMMAPLWMVVTLSVCLTVYAFPLMMYYNETLKQTVSNAIMLGIGNFPTTVMTAFIHIGVLIVLLSFNEWSVILGSLLMFIGFALIALICSAFIRRIFKKSEQNGTEQPAG